MHWRMFNYYCTKYTTKAKKSHANTAFTDIASNKSLQSRLWHVAMRALSHRECGALEASDTLLGISYFRPRYSNKMGWCKYGPVELESMNLHEFLAWHNMVGKQPSDSAKYYPMLMFDCSINDHTWSITTITRQSWNPKSTSTPCCFCLSLGRIAGDNPTYTEAFNACKDDLLEGLKYHSQLIRLQGADVKVHQQIRERWFVFLRSLQYYPPTQFCYYFFLWQKWLVLPPASLSFPQNSHY